MMRSLENAVTARTQAARISSLMLPGLMCVGVACPATRTGHFFNERKWT